MPLTSDISDAFNSILGELTGHGKDEPHKDDNPTDTVKDNNSSKNPKAAATTASQALDQVATILSNLLSHDYPTSALDKTTDGNRTTTISIASPTGSSDKMLKLYRDLLFTSGILHLFSGLEVEKIRRKHEAAGDHSASVSDTKSVIQEYRDQADAMNNAMNGPLAGLYVVSGAVNGSTTRHVNRKDLHSLSLESWFRGIDALDNSRVRPGLAKLVADFTRDFDGYKEPGNKSSLPLVLPAAARCLVVNYVTRTSMTGDDDEKDEDLWECHAVTSLIYAEISVVTAKGILPVTMQEALGAADIRVEIKSTVVEGELNEDMLQRMRPKLEKLVDDITRGGQGDGASFDVKTLGGDLEDSIMTILKS